MFLCIERLDMCLSDIERQTCQYTNLYARAPYDNTTYSQNVAFSFYKLDILMWRQLHKCWNIAFMKYDDKCVSVYNDPKCWGLDSHSSYMARFSWSPLVHKNNVGTNLGTWKCCVTSWPLCGRKHKTGFPLNLEYRIYCEATFELVGKPYMGVGNSLVILNFGPHTKGYFTLV